MRGVLRNAQFGLTVVHMSTGESKAADDLDESKTVLYVTVSGDIKQRLREIARREERSMTNATARALRLGVAMYEKGERPDPA